MEIKRKNLKRWSEKQVQWDKKMHNRKMQDARREINSGFPSFKDTRMKELKHLYGGNRLKVFRRDKFTCRECKTKALILHVHHKDLSEKSSTPNNKMSNLITLCCSCHTKLHMALKKG